MYQQTTVDNIHLLHANKMAETLMRLQQQQGQDYGLQSSAVNDRRSVDEAHRTQYDHSSSVLNFAAPQHQQAAQSSATNTGMSSSSGVETDGGSSLFVVIPRTEYDFMKQELLGLKHSLNELKSSVGYEINQLKTESKSLKQRVDCCTCSGNVHIKDGNGGRKSTWSSESGSTCFVFLCSRWCCVQKWVFAWYVSAIHQTVNAIILSEISATNKMSLEIPILSRSLHYAQPWSILLKLCMECRWKKWGSWLPVVNWCSSSGCFHLW